MDVEVVIGGSSKRILVRIPSGQGFSSGVMLGVPSPRLIQLGDNCSSCTNKENCMNPDLSLPESSKYMHTMSSSETNYQIAKDESHSTDVSAITDITNTLEKQRLKDNHGQSVLQCANPNISREIEKSSSIDMETDDELTYTELYNQRLKNPFDYDKPVTNKIQHNQMQHPRKGCESQTSKLIAKRIVYLADAAVNKLFGPPEELAPEFIPHARQLRQQLLVSLAAVVKEHLKQRASSDCLSSQMQRQIVQDDDFQRTLRPTVQTRVR